MTTDTGFARIGRRDPVARYWNPALDADHQRRLLGIHDHHPYSLPLVVISPTPQPTAEDLAGTTATPIVPFRPLFIGTLDHFAIRALSPGGYRELILING